MKRLYKSKSLLNHYQTETSVVDVIWRPVLNLIGSSVILGGVKSTIRKSDVLLAFLPTKSYPTKQCNIVGLRVGHTIAD